MDEQIQEVIKELQEIRKIPTWRMNLYRLVKKCTSVVGSLVILYAPAIRLYEKGEADASLIYALSITLLCIFLYLLSIRKDLKLLWKLRTLTMQKEKERLATLREEKQNEEVVIEEVVL